MTHEIKFHCIKITLSIIRKTLGWQQQEYIALKTLRKSLGIIILMLLIPFLKMFHISDINLLIICNLLNGLGFLLASISMFYMPLIFIGKDLAEVRSLSLSNENSPCRNYSDSIPVPQVCSRQISTQVGCLIFFFIYLSVFPFSYYVDCKSVPRIACVTFHSLNPCFEK